MKCSDEVVQKFAEWSYTGVGICLFLILSCFLGVLLGGGVSSLVKLFGFRDIWLIATFFFINTIFWDGKSSYIYNRKNHVFLQPRNNDSEIVEYTDRQLTKSLSKWGSRESKPRVIRYDFLKLALYFLDLRTYFFYVFPNVTTFVYFPVLAQIWKRIINYLK